MIVNAKKFSDSVLVYDRYYSSKPRAVLLILERILLCCGIVLCSMMFLLDEYRLPVSTVGVVIQSLAFSAGFSVLFVFVKKRFAIPAVVGLGLVITAFVHEQMLEKLSYFSDAMWLVMDGRFVPGKLFTEHLPEQLTASSYMYCSGVQFGLGMVVFLFSMLTAACMFSKPHIFPSFAVWIVLWIPTMISETLTFSVWYIPAFALYIGAWVHSGMYSQGLVLCGSVKGSYSDAAVYSENRLKKTLQRMSYFQQVELRSVYYSKFMSSVVYIAAVAAAVGIAAASIFPKGGIDYTKLYDFVVSLKEKSPFYNPFEDGDAEEWFTNPQEITSTRPPSLGIVSPGRGNQKLLSVVNNGNAVVYLRGDIGIDFEGSSWTSPVSAEPKQWIESDLRSYYRPVELSVLNTLQQMLYGESSSILHSDVTVEYLCDSTVTFLPAYTQDFGYFDSEMFSVYGDFVIRASESYDRIESVNCTALVPVYTNMDDTDGTAIENLRKAAGLAAQRGGVADIINGGYFSGQYDVFDKYRDYVDETYLSIDSDDLSMIEDFLDESGLGAMLYGTVFDENEIVSGYQKATLVAEYLRNNFTYSLNAGNDPDNALYSFLNTTKSGHCALYASSMTLVMRSLGIPARYCTGFVVTPNGDTPTVLRTKNLHAWCEVYLDELGWVTFDPTSSTQTGTTSAAYEESGSSSAASSQESIDESSQDSSGESSHTENSESIEASSSAMSYNSGSGTAAQPHVKVNVLPYLFAIGGGAAVIIAVILIVQQYRRSGERSRKTLKKIRASGNADVLLEKILLVMSVCDVAPTAGELPSEFYARAEKAFGCSVTDYSKILENAAFGNGNIDKTDYARLAGLLERLYDAAEIRLSLFGKIRLRKAVLK